MCGIAGFSGHFDESLLVRMNKTISHRGPDDSGHYWDPERGIGLAHRRLSIIDLSEHGRQPMWDTTKTVAITFNGEIYNYQELRNRLIRDGFSFHSESDTEVILNLYLREGTRMLALLNGMYAFALWDSRNRTLFIARDGIGIKPFYYSVCSKGFLFASELKALLQETEVKRDIDLKAVHYYISYLWCPSPLTMLESVKKLEPGTAIAVKEGKIVKKWQFYELPYNEIDEKITEEEAADLLRRKLDKAVKRQLMGDVPVGSFLSGGLDSSSLVSSVCRSHPHSKIKCFTIDYDEANGNEGIVKDLPYALKVAKHLGIDLYQVKVGSEIADHLSEMVYHLDEPQADPAPLNVYLICKLARKNGIKVLLSGAGGDDIFSGYRRHYALNHEKFWAWLPLSIRAILAKEVANLPAKYTLTRRIQKALQFASFENNQRIASYFHWIAPSLQNKLYGPSLFEATENIPFSSPLVSSLNGLSQSTHPLNKMLFLEAKHFLADHNLNYTDKMSMAAGVEVRVPLLDPDLIALSARLPVNFKQRGKIGKWIFKKAMESRLPANIVYRPKTGFALPLRSWLNNELNELVGDTLSPIVLKKRGLLSAKGVNELLALNKKGQIDGTYTIFSLVCMELWFQHFIDK